MDGCQCVNGYSIGPGNPECLYKRFVSIVDFNDHNNVRDGEYEGTCNGESQSVANALCARRGQTAAKQCEGACGCAWGQHTFSCR